MIVPLISTALRSTVTASAQQLGAMAATRSYLFTSTVACYVKQGANPTATAGDASMLVAAGGSVFLWGGDGTKISVIRATADGECTLTQVGSAPGAPV